MADWEKADLRDMPIGRLLESARWKPLLELVGLNEVMADRLLRILLIHLTVDSVIAYTLTLKLLVNDKFLSANFEKLTQHVAKMPIARRANLCVALGIATTAWEIDFKAFNLVRNNLAHFNPKSGLEKVEELRSESAFNACIQQGFRAMKVTGGQSLRHFIPFTEWAAVDE